MNLQEAYNLAKRNKKACANAPDHPLVRNGVSFPALITNATMEKDRTGIVVEFCIWMNSEGIKKECRFSLKGNAENYFTCFCDDLGVEDYKALPGIPLWISFEMNDIYQNVRIDDASITIEELKEAIDAQKTGKTSGKKKRASSLNFAENPEQEDFDEDFDPEILQEHIDTVKQRKKKSSTATKVLKRRRAVQRKQEDFEEEFAPEDSEEEFESDDFDTEEDFEPENLQEHIDTVKQRRKSKKKSSTATKVLKRRRAVQQKQEDFEEESEPDDSDDFEEEFESDDFDTEED